ncbi:hypothetical protein RDV89_11880 [Nocardioides zeae]|uniref:YqeB PH domain-containing protein n=1 Tax=Nocardioides imazamoxiresistens TaxID=3231893 RepID=A0ABU3PX05_9ACTN|nr:hypothetical protein [Nocardioides zeae]MDT9593771.1 hypothetical protein [Nocardioides zeae]
MNDESAPGVPASPGTGGHDDLGMTRQDAVWTYVLLGLGGVALLVLGPLAARWLAGADLPLVPFRDTLAWIGGFDQWWAWVVRPLVGLGAGLAMAAVVVDEEWHLEVHDDHVLTRRGRDRRRLERSGIVGVHLEKKHVVIEGEHGRVLFDHPVEARGEQVREVFTSRGYPYESL